MMFEVGDKLYCIRPSRFLTVGKSYEILGFHKYTYNTKKIFSLNPLKFENFQYEKTAIQIVDDIGKSQSFFLMMIFMILGRIVL